MSTRQRPVFASMFVLCILGASVCEGNVYYGNGEDAAAYGSVTVSGFDSGPRITVHSPSGSVTGPISHVEVTFSKAIQSATFSGRDFTLNGPQGTYFASSIEHVSGNTYRINFTVQSVAGNYTFTVGPEINGIDGYIMDQDGDPTNGYDEYSGSFTVDAIVDTTPPTPNPSTWSLEPYATSATSIRMVASTASDPSGVEYYFEAQTPGANDSGWQDSPAYEDTRLSPKTTYIYRLKTRDNSANHNETDWSSTRSDKTHTPNGIVVAWNSGNSSQLDIPVGLSNVTAIATGYYCSLALKSNGKVVAWGNNQYGQTDVPSGLSDVTAIAMGERHNLALKSNGTIVPWGDNQNNGPGDVPSGLSDVTAIAAGHWHSLALKSNGTVVAWGNNYYGETDVPSGLSGVTAIATGYYHSLALKSNGTVVAWGDNRNGQTDVPSGLSGVTSIAAGLWHNLALKSDDTVVAWGYNHYGQTDVPVGLSDVATIAAGYYYSLALKKNGTVVAWGYNQNGQTDVPSDLSGVTAIAAGSFYSLAVLGLPAPNREPTIDSLSATPSQVIQGDNITLTANNVRDDDGDIIERVTFYHDSNNNGYWDSSDESLYSDFSSSDGWEWTGSSSGLPIGINHYFARAYDGELWSSAKSTQGTVTLNTSPAVSLVSPQNWHWTTTPKFTWEGHDSDQGDVLTYKLFIGDGQDPFDNPVKIVDVGTAQKYKLTEQDGLDIPGWCYSWGVQVYDGNHDSNSLESRYITITESNPQRVVLAWDTPCPVSINHWWLFGRNWYPVDEDGTMAPSTFLTDNYKATIRQNAQNIFASSGINRVLVTDVTVDASQETLIYFTDWPIDDSSPTGWKLPGKAYSGVDQFNTSSGGGAVVFLRGSPGMEANVVAHETGHTFGLRHVEPADNEVMKNTATTNVRELFINAVSWITDDGDEEKSHNPRYHLKRYVDGDSHNYLIGQDIFPGTWDLNALERVEIVLNLISTPGPDQTLYNVYILAMSTGSGDEESLDTLAHFDQISLSELAQERFKVYEGTVVNLIAASEPNGTIDTVLATGDPYIEDNTSLGLSEPVTTVYLQTQVGSSYTTVATGTALVSRLVSIQKCKVKAGKAAGKDSISFAGILEDITADDLNGAGEIYIAIVSDVDGHVPYHIDNDPLIINQAKVKKGKYSHRDKQKGISFKIDTKKGKFALKIKNADLTGLGCPLTVEIEIGDYSGIGSVGEAVVNGKKKPIPIQLMSGYKDTLPPPLKIKAKKGKKEFTDSLAVKGGFSLKDEPSPITSMTLSLGDQSLDLTDDAGTFTYKRDKKTSKIKTAAYKTDKGVTPRIKAKLDFVKCRYSISIKKAELETTSGQTTIGVLIDMSLSGSDYNESVEVHLN